jgi:hypothetical protein
MRQLDSRQLLPKKYSQSGQDGIIEEIFKNIGTTNKFCVEFGHDSDTLESSNTGRLLSEDGWTGLLMDGSHENPEINLHKEFITSKNIVELFDKYHVPLEPDFVSVDIDSCDLWVMKSIMESKYRPRVVSCEYNPAFKLDFSVTIPDDPTFAWDGESYVYGASLAAINKASRQSGYKLVAVVWPCDAFMIREDLIDVSKSPHISYFENKTGNTIHKHPKDLSARDIFVPY